MEDGTVDFEPPEGIKLYSPPVGSAVPSKKVWLEVIRNGTVVQTLPLSGKGDFLIGSSKDEVDLRLEGDTISKFHAAIQFDKQGRLYVKCLSIEHPVYKNKERIDASEFVPIDVGDQIHLGGEACVDGALFLTVCGEADGHGDRGRDLGGSSSSSDSSGEESEDLKEEASLFVPRINKEEYNTSLLFDENDDFYDRTDRKRRHMDKTSSSDGASKRNHADGSVETSTTLEVKIADLEERVVQLKEKITALKASSDVSTEEEDPLDAFMKQNEEQLQKDDRCRLQKQLEAALHQLELNKKYLRVILR